MKPDVSVVERVSSLKDCAMLLFSQAYLPLSRFCVMDFDKPLRHDLGMAATIRSMQISGKMFTVGCIRRISNRTFR